MVEPGPNVHNPSPGEVEVRQLVLAVFRRWRLIAGVLAAVVAAVLVRDTLVVRPYYESTAEVRFDLSEEMLGVDFRAIQRIAVGPAVLSAVSEAIGLEEGPGEMAERFDFDFLRDVSAISVTARASTAQEAHDLVQRWIEAIQDEVRRLMESEFELLETVAKENYERQVQALAESENALAAFDRDRSLDLLEAEYRHTIDLERERLQRQVAEALTQVQGALAELGEIRRLEPELARLSRVEIIVAPALPDSPVSPRLAFDLVIGAMLGLTLGVAAAIVAEWWRGHRVSMGRGRQEISIS